MKTPLPQGAPSQSLPHPRTEMTTMFRGPQGPVAVVPSSQPAPPSSPNCLSGCHSERPRVTLKTIKPHTLQNNSPPTSVNMPLLYQTDICGSNIEKDDLESFGDTMGKKAANVFRIMLQNINNLPISALVNSSRQVIDCIANQELDVFLMTKIGLCWPKVSAYDQFKISTTSPPRR
jgi:hypothetical protein